MASSNSLQPIRHHYHNHNNTLPRQRRHSLDSSLTPPPLSFTSSSSSSSSTSTPGSLFLKRQHQHSSLISKLRSISFSTAATAFTGSSPVTTTTPSPPPTTFDALRNHLINKNFREADEVTRRLLIKLAGESAQKRGYVYFSEVQFIKSEDLRAIDKLWIEHSDGRYGYSVQRKIWKKLNSDFSKFFINVGWMKRLENSEIEQYNYRSFPSEFVWELADDTPQGHLPLTNALRGTQLLTKIFNHPAFEEEEEEEETIVSPSSSGFNLSSEIKKPLSKLFKSDYTF